MLRTTTLRHVAFLLGSLTLVACSDSEESDPGPTATDPDSAYQGSCDFPSTATCSDYGFPQATAQSASECMSSGGTWTAEVQCPVPMRFALCSSTVPSSRTYAYTPEAAMALKGTCPAESFRMLMVAPPPSGGMGGSGGMAGAAGTAGTAGMPGDEDAGM